MQDWFDAIYAGLWTFWAPFGGVAAGVLGAIAIQALKFLTTLTAERRERVASDEAFRKLDAKKHNEHLKLFGSFCNTVGAAIIGAAFIVPYIGQHVTPDQVDVRWIGAGLALPLAGHIALRFMKSEG